MESSLVRCVPWSEPPFKVKLFGAWGCQEVACSHPGGFRAAISLLPWKVYPEVAFVNGLLLSSGNSDRK
jgi:hypothetical protein